MSQLFEMIRRRLRRSGIMAGDIFGPASDRSFCGTCSRLFTAL